MGRLVPSLNLYVGVWFSECSKWGSHKGRVSKVLGWWLGARGSQEYYTPQSVSGLQGCVHFYPNPSGKQLTTGLTPGHGQISFSGGCFSDAYLALNLLFVHSLQAPLHQPQKWKKEMKYPNTRSFKKNRSWKKADWISEDNSWIRKWKHKI